MKFLLIVPVHNSEKKILDVIADLETNAPDIDILLIDQGSDDRTKYLIPNSGMNYLKMPVAADYYDAVSLGMHYALHKKYDAVIEWDDKNRFDSKDLAYFMRTMEKQKTDFVFGSRFHEKKVPKTPRYYGTRSLSFLIKMISGKKVTDPTLRMKVYGKKPIEFFAKNEFQTPTPDVIARLIKLGYTFTEAQTNLMPGVKQQLHDGKKGAFKRVVKWWFSILFVQPFTLITHKIHDTQKIKKSKGVTND